MSVPTTVHWHGMELESVYDGVSGWSGVGASRSPMVMPGDSFTVAFTPPRAGTFMYHTHMDEEAQLTRGMYAPMIVLEPGEAYDPKRDFVFMFGRAIVGGKEEGVLNGRKTHAPLELAVGLLVWARLTISSGHRVKQWMRCSRCARWVRGLSRWTR